MKNWRREWDSQYGRNILLLQQIGAALVLSYHVSYHDFDFCTPLQNQAILMGGREHLTSYQLRIPYQPTFCQYRVVL